MPHSRKNHQRFLIRAYRQDGFIAVVSIGLFALLAFFGLIVQTTVIDTFRSVTDTNNYYSARDVAESTVEYLQWTIQQREAGYNTAAMSGGTVITCNFPTGASTTPGGQDPICDPILNILSDNRPVTVDLEVKGRAEVGEYLATNECHGSFGGFVQNIGNCYTVPFPGTGAASDMCDLYSPTMGSSSNVDIPVNLAGNTANRDQLEYACNWNKLSFGSSLTDRVNIPLYFDQGGPSINIFNPYNNEQGAASANDLILRLRTPCLPCIYSGTPTTVNGAPINRLCQAGQDPSSCDYSNRYVLDTTPTDDIVAQWQINGQCLNASTNQVEACGLVPAPTGATISSLSESRISNSNNSTSNNALLDNLSAYGFDTSTQILTPVTNNDIPAPLLPAMRQPGLTLFLNEPLIATSGYNIPYLEYQLLTNYPVSNSRSSIRVSVNVDGNIFTKTLDQQVSKNLIDFAVQN